MREAIRAAIRLPNNPPPKPSKFLSALDDPYRGHRAWDVLEVGGVLTGDVPSFRVDNMPYGGVKESGVGREGVRFAMEDMPEVRLLWIRTPPARG